MNCPWFCRLKILTVYACAFGFANPHRFVEAADAANDASLPLITQEVEIGAIRFTLPATMRLEKIAEEPLIRWPVVAAWDHDRSLLILESNWNRESVQQQLVSRPHRIVRLTDTDNDGNFDHRVVVADKLSFSAGLLVIDEDTLLVSSPPVIVQLDDRDGDGIYESESIWHDGRTVTHCANDLHGPMLGPDGWIYWTKGAFAEQTHQLGDDKQLISKAAHMLRRHPQGKDVEVVMTGGMDNPVDVAFLPDGERLFCSTFLHRPGDGIRDGIAHAVYGSVFGKPNDVLNGHPLTGPLMKPIVELGPAAPASVTHLKSDRVPVALGMESFDRTGIPYAIASQFNLQKLSLHQLVPQGATFAPRNQDLLSANQVDFHPVDVLEDRDGSLIVLDTGGWYDLCCPSSGTRGQVAPGGIYRLSTIEEASEGDELASTRTTPGNESLMELVRDEQQRLSLRLDAFWSLAARLVDTPEDAEIWAMIAECLESFNESIQRAALNVVSLYRRQDTESKLFSLLESGPLMTQRLAAECLGRLTGNEEMVIKALMNAIASPHRDRTLDHAIVYAMIERSSSASIRHYLTSERPRQRWAAMMVLEQTKQITLADASIILLQTASTDEAVATLALKIATAHPEFAAPAMKTMEAWWATNDAASHQKLQNLLERWWNVEQVSSQVSLWLANYSSFNAKQTESGILALSYVQGQAIPHAWVAPIADWVSYADQITGSRLAASLSQVKWTLPQEASVVAALLAKLNDSGTPISERTGFVLALPPATEGVAEDVLATIAIGLTSEDESMASTSTTALPHVRLPLSTATTLIEQLEGVSPVNLQPVITAILQVNDAKIDATLLAKFSTLTSAKSVPPSAIMNAIGNRSPSVRKTWSRTLETIAAPPADVGRVVDDWLAKLPEGDAVRGHQVFRGSKAACVQCHQVGYVGGKVGPELTRIGKSRTRRDFVEAILYPSARLEQSYQPTRVLLTDGRVLNGMLVNKSDKALELICGVDERCFVSMDDVEIVEPSDVSIMPAGLEQTLTLQQFADLIAFLENAR